MALLCKNDQHFGNIDGIVSCLDRTADVPMLPVLMIARLSALCATWAAKEMLLEAERS